VDAFLSGSSAHPQRTGPAQPLRPPRATHIVAVVLVVVGLGVGWATSFRYTNVRSSSVPWAQTYIKYARQHLHENPRLGDRRPR
jgi:hypothetical protein